MYSMICRDSWVSHWFFIIRNFAYLQLEMHRTFVKIKLNFRNFAALNIFMCVSFVKAFLYLFLTRVKVVILLLAKRKFKSIFFATL